MNEKEGGKTPIGIVVSAILLILLGAQVLGFGVVAFVLLEGFTAGGIFAIIMPIIILALLAIIIVPAIGLLKRKNWARIMTIILEAIIILWKIVSAIISKRTTGLTFLGAILGMLVPVAVAAFIISYLSNKKTRQFFD